MPFHHRTPEPELNRHVAAARAFHTGLVAETHRRLHLLRKIADHIEVLRHPTKQHEQKLAAAEASCRHLRSLAELGKAWRDTYSDLSRSLRRVREHFRRIVKK